jgi:hypothetical protein
MRIRTILAAAAPAALAAVLLGTLRSQKGDTNR